MDRPIKKGNAFPLTAVTAPQIGEGLGMGA